jgi:hypothetical protein
MWYHPYQTNYLELDINAIKVDSAASWLSNTKLNYIQTILVGCFVMFLENVSISKRAVNGAT